MYAKQSKVNNFLDLHPDKRQDITNTSIQMNSRIQTVGEQGLTLKSKKNQTKCERSRKMVTDKSICEHKI